MNLKDRNGKDICEGADVRYYDSTGMWLTSQIKDVGGALALMTDENPILLYDFINQYEYDGHNISEIEVIDKGKDE